MTTTDRLNGVNGKVRRGKEQFDALERAIRRFVHGDDYAVELEQQAGDEFAVIGTGLRDPPRVKWGIRVGDIVHNWRSALDHLVWELSDAHEGPAPDDPIDGTSRWRSIAFPIVTDAARWERALERQLWAVDPGLYPIFQEVQPFETRSQHEPPRPAEREQLAVLQDLWNIDKHRRIHLTDIEISLNAIKILVAETRRPMPHVYSVEPVSRPFKGVTELARIRGIHTPDLSEGERIALDAHWELAYDILFGPGAPCYGAGLIDTLSGLHDTIKGVIAKFEPSFLT